MKRIMAILVGMALPVAFALFASAHSNTQEAACYQKIAVLTDGGSAGGFASADAAFTAGAHGWKVGDPGVERRVGSGSVRFTYQRDGRLEQEIVASQNQSGAWFVVASARRIPCQ